MEILRYIFHLGIVFIIFDLIWWFFIVVLTAAVGREQKAKIENFVLKPLSYYLLVTAAAVSALSFIEKQESAVSAYTYGIIGLMTLYFYLAGKLRKKRIKIMFNNVAQNEPPKTTRYDGIFLLLAVGLFVASVFYPPMAKTPVTDWLLQTISDIYDTPVIGWIIGLVGVFFLIRMIIIGITMSNKLIGRLFEPGDRKSRQQQQDPYANDGEFVDYEVVEDDDDDEPTNNGTTHLLE